KSLAYPTTLTDDYLFGILLAIAPGKSTMSAVPVSTLVAERKPQFNPLAAINMMSLLFAVMATGFVVGAKLARDELRQSNSD
ncbi:MAG: hypothetical protein DCF32_22880, partial [Leptolyngbya sp.]